MKPTEFESWRKENSTSCEDMYFNGIHYKFCELLDNWIAIFEVDSYGYYPMIQAADREHAESWCFMREPVTVPMQQIC